MLTHNGTKTIETENLILRRFKYDDVEDVLKYWASDEKVQSLYCEPVYSTYEEVRNLLGKYIDGYSKNNYYRWAIICKENNKCIGQIAYFLVDDNNNFAEIEYCISREFQCRGLATEAAKAVIKFGFDNINLHKVQICHKSINIPSKRVIEKSGCTYEGTLRDFFYEDGKYIDHVYYSILRDEFYKDK